MSQYRNLSETAVKNLAVELALALKDHAATIGLIGPLGAGKTTFIKAFARSFGIKHTSSPTFVISHEYPAALGKFYHLDFYRLHKPEELLPLGIAEMRTGSNIVVMEWVDRFPKLMKQCDILITLKPKAGNKRDVTIRTKK